MLRERGHELLCRLVEPCRIRIAARLQVDLEAARSADAADRRRIEGERQAVAQARALLHDVARDQLGAVGAALVPFLERHEHGGGIALVAAADEIEADDADGVLHAAIRGDDLHHVVGHLARALERSAVGELQRGEDVALVLRRHEAAGNAQEKPARDGEHHDEGEERGDAVRQHQVHGPEEAAREPGEAAVERPEEARLVLARLHEERAQGRGQRERHEARDHDRESERQRELPVELAGDAAEERDGHEHRAKHEHDGDHRARDLAHRFERRLEGRHPVLAHQALDVLQHDDGVVHHDADREDQREERERVYREAHCPEPGKGADQRHGHRDHRDERRSPGLQEEEHDREHQQRRLKNGFGYLPDRRIDEARGVERNGVVDVVGEAGLEVRHARSHELRDLERVGARLQERRHADGGLAVDGVVGVVVERAKLDARDVAQPQDPARTRIVE